MAQNLLSYETMVHATAGAVGSVVAMTVFYPLDTVRFRLQLESDDDLRQKNLPSILYHIVKKEGLESLYRGIKPVLISLGTSNFVYFYTFHGLKSLLKNTGQNDLMLGSIAGIINVLLTTPLWVVNSRLKSPNPQPFVGLLDGLLHIANTEGVSSLWSGTGPSLMLVSNPAIQFAVYESLKRNINARSAGAFFLMGAFAKAVATIVTYPVQLAQTLKRHGKNAEMETAALLLTILKRNGPAALFRGLEAKLFQTVLTAALMFMTYEKIARFVFMLLLRHSRKQ